MSKHFFFCLVFMTIIAMPGTSWAQETAPGDACGTTGLFSIAAGPESLSGYLLYCDGTVWQSILGYDSVGNSGVMFNSAGTAQAPVHIEGELIIGAGSLSCDGLTEGAIRYNSTGQVIDYCDGSSWTAISGGGGGTGYDIAAFMPETPNSSAVVRVILPRDVRLVQNLTGSECLADVAANAATTVVLNKVSGGTTTQIGTANWAPSATTCTFSFVADVDFASGDIVEIEFPATPDSTLADISITLVGTRL